MLTSKYPLIYRNSVSTNHFHPNFKPLSPGFFSLSCPLDFSLMGVYKVGSLKQKIFYLNGHDFFFFFAVKRVRKKNVTVQKKNSQDSL